MLEGHTLENLVRFPDSGGCPAPVTVRTCSRLILYQSDATFLRYDGPHREHAVVNLIAAAFRRFGMARQGEAGMARSFVGDQMRHSCRAMPVADNRST